MELAWLRDTRSAQFLVNTDESISVLPDGTVLFISGNTWRSRAARKSRFLRRLHIFQDFKYVFTKVLGGPDFLRPIAVFGEVFNGVEDIVLVEVVKQKIIFIARSGWVPLLPSKPTLSGREVGFFLAGRIRKELPARVTREHSPPTSANLKVRRGRLRDNWRAQSRSMLLRECRLGPHANGPYRPPVSKT